MSNILEVKDLNVSYGGIKAVKDISFAVPKGEVVTLIGANGAGKSSTLRSIVGLVKPESGSILLKGEELAGMPTEQIVTKGITLVPEGRRVFPDMTVAENLKIGAYMRKDSLDEDMNWVYDLFPRLKERSWQLAGTLSGGEQQMLAIGRALMSRPEIIMMDEPSLILGYFKRALHMLQGMADLRYQRVLKEIPVLSLDADFSVFNQKCMKKHMVLLFYLLVNRRSMGKSSLSVSSVISSSSFVVNSLKLNRIVESKSSFFT